MGSVAVAALVLSAAGTGLAAAGQMQAGKSAEDQAEFNAATARNEATATRQKARFDRARQAKEGSRIKGALAARAAKSGARTDVGSPVLVAAEQAAELELDNLLIGFEGETMARKHESQARIDEFGGSVSKQASRIGAGSTMLQGFGSAMSMGGGGKGKVPKAKTRSSAAKSYHGVTR